MFDYAVIGGGIVGLATARALHAGEPAARIVVIEKEAEVARHQTGHNSGVVHAGIYYAPGSLKSRLCTAGLRATKDFCQEHALPLEQCGKLIVATNEVEVGRMADLADRAAASGIAVEQLSQGALNEVESEITGLGALLVRTTAITDYGRIAGRLSELLLGDGVEIRLSSRVLAIREHVDAVDIETPHGAIEARRLVACAGLQSDRIARAAGLRPPLQIVPFRGEYYMLAARSNALVRHLIYPVPDPRLPFLGAHLTRTIDGRITVGPNAVPGMAREIYRRGAVNLVDIIQNLSFPGFWRLAAQHWRTALGEAHSSISRSHFLAQCRKYCPSLALEDLGEYHAGIRAQAVHRDGQLIQDFYFAQTARMLHVLNAPSPAATSAFPIGAMIAERIRG